MQKEPRTPTPSTYVGRFFAVVTLLAFAGGHHTLASPAQKPEAKPKASPPISATSGAGPVPVLKFASYLHSAADRINAVAVGPDGTVYVAGVTLTSVAAIDATKKSAGEGKAFVAHLSADGSKLLYIHYLGNSGLSEARAVAVDGSGNAYVTGETHARDLPVLNALQFTCNLNASDKCTGDAFVTELNPEGSLVFSTYLGGSGEDAGNAIAVDASGNVYVAGSTTSTDFPIFKAAQGTTAGHGTAFVAKFTASDSLVYATYLGGTGADEARGIAVDTAGNVYITGRTTSLDFPTHNAIQSGCHLNAKNACAGQAFLTKLSADGSTFLYSTYLGGSSDNAANAIAVDPEGNTYITGVTHSVDFPLASPLQSTPGGQGDAFITKISPDGSALLYSTYLGGSRANEANAIAVDQAGNAFLSGWTQSSDFPTHNPIQAACQRNAQGSCSVDAFVAALDPTGAKLLFGSYLGGSGVDATHAIAVDTKSSAYLGGWTASTDFPQAKTALEPGSAASQTSVSVGPSGGGFVAKLSGIVGSAGPAACTNNWTGTAGDNQWTTATNWSTGAVPTSADNACISATFSAKTITVGSLAVANQTIASLSSGAPISFTNGPLTISGTATFSADLKLSGGALALNGTSSMTTLEQSSGILTGAGALTITGLFTWTGGNMCTVVPSCGLAGTQAVTNANGGISTGASSVSFTLDSRTLNVSGTTNLGSASSFAELFELNGAIVNNQSGATWNLLNTSDGIFNNGGTGTNTFNNAGTFQMTGGTTITVSVAFNNNTGGSVSVSTGTLNFTGGGTEVAGFSAASGATLEFSAGTLNLNAGTTFSGTGTFEIASGTVIVPTSNTVTWPSLNFAGGILTGSGTVTITGLFTWTGGNMCTVVPSCGLAGTQAVTNANGGISTGASSVSFTLDSRTLNVSGTTNLGSASSFAELFEQDGAIVNNQSGATWNLLNTSDGIFNNGGTGTNTFNNAGTFQMTGGTTVTVSVAFNNNTGGKVTVSAGTLNFSGGGTEVAGFTTGAGTTLEFSSATFNLNAGTTFSGTGTFEIASGTVIVPTSNTVTWPSLNFAGGILTGSGTVTITGLFTWTGGNMCTVVPSCGLAGTQAVTNANGGISTGLNSVSFTLDSRTLNVSGTTNLGSASSFAELFQQDGAIVNNQAGAMWKLLNTNDGIFNNGGTGTNTFNNAGTFAMTGGTSVTVNVVFNNNAGGSVSVSTGTLVLSGGGTEVAKFSTSTGTTLEFSSATFNLNAGTTFSGTGTFELASGSIVVPTATTVTFPSLNFAGGTLTGSGTVTITGLLTWTGGNMCTVVPSCGLAGTQAVTNANGGISTGPNTVSFLLDSRSLNVSGTTKFGSASTFAELFLQDGATVSNTSKGTWSLLNTNDGIFNNGGTGTNTFNNAGTFQMTGGTSATVSVAFNNTGSVIGKTGTLTFSGNYTQTKGTTTLSGGNFTFSGGAPTLTESAGSVTGSGTITGNLTNTAGIVSPGASTPKVTTGTITLTGSGVGNYTQGAGGTLDINIGGTLPAQIDQINASGTATLSGTIDICLINGFKPANGTNFTIMTYASHSGTFSTVNFGWTLTYNSTSLVATYNGAPEITISPASVAYPSQLVGTTSAPQTVKVTNVDGTLTFTSVTITGAASSNYTITSNTCTGSLTAGQNCLIMITFTPSVLGTRSASLTIVDNDCDSPHNVPLTGKGTELTLSPSPVPFGNQTVGTTSAPITVTLTNNGGPTVTLKTFTFTGTNKGDFAISSKTCGATLTGGTNCTINITFKPLAKGARTATLTVTDSEAGSPQTDTLTGTGN